MRQCGIVSRGTSLGSEFLSPPVFSPLLCAHQEMKTKYPYKPPYLLKQEINVFGRVRRAGLRHTPEHLCLENAGVGGGRVWYVSAFSLLLSKATLFISRA